MPQRALIVGIDGGTFRYLGPLMERGELKALRRLADEGVRADLISSMPPVTPTAWSNFITGKTPAKHRITDFLIRKGCGYDQKATNARERRGRPFWEILGRGGQKTLILNIPMTYPPAPVNGVIISGFLSPSGKRDFVQPPELLDEIEAKFGPYQIYPRLVFSALKSRKSIEAFVQSLEAMLHYKVDVAEYLLQKMRPDLVVFHIWGTDLLQHQLWALMDPGHDGHDAKLAGAVKDTIEDYYREVDRSIQRLQEAFGQEDAVCLVLSDHGFGQIRKAVELNAWLLREGYLALKKRTSTRIRHALWKWGATLDNLSNFLFRLSSLVTPLLERLFKFTLPRFEQVLTLAWRKRTPFFLSLNDVDWSRTRAYSRYGIGQIVLNVRGREPEGIVEPGDEYWRLRDEIVSKLVDLRDPETGERVAEEVLTKDRWKRGAFYDEVADILVPPSASGYEARTPSNIIFSNKVLYATPLAVGHKMDGIFLASGGPIRRGATPDTPRIEDIAPTVIHMMGHEVPEDMDGRVLTEIFTEAFAKAQPVRFGKSEPQEEYLESEMSEAEDEEILNKLHDLGYID